VSDRFKFRAWDKELKKMFHFTLKDLWAEGCEQQLIELDDSKRLSLNSEFPYENIEQSTGLKDKNGKLIFEGDIIQIGDFCPFEVVYELSQKSDLMGYGQSFFREFGDMSKTEIIGNIHENPELLEKS